MIKAEVRVFTNGNYYYMYYHNQPFFLLIKIRIFLINFLKKKPKEELFRHSKKNN